MSYLFEWVLPGSRIEQEFSVRYNDKYVDVEHGFPLCRQVWCVYPGWGNFDSLCAYMEGGWGLWEYYDFGISSGSQIEQRCGRKIDSKSF